jgi:adenine-specific DNA-methyltransferase
MMVGETTQSSAHYLVWYARDNARMKHQKVFDQQIAGVGSGDHYTQVEECESKEIRPLTPEEKANPKLIPTGWRAFQLVSLTTGGFRPNTTIDYTFEGKTYHPGANKCWRTTREGLDRLTALGRIARAGNTLRYRQFLDDFPLTEVTTIWQDTARDPENFYVVQTPSNVIRRCLLMTTDPGDLVLDPTCGSGTTAYVAEQWGRRWITCDTSRVPLALARQRLLTATFDYYELKDEARGPAGGFVYRRKQNQKGEEVGGIVPHITLKSIANNEPPAEEVLVDRPEVVKNVVRVTGPFSFEATIPTAEGLDTAPDTPGIQGAQHESYVQRMLEVLRKAPVLRLPGNQTVTLKNIRPPAKTLALSAEAVVSPVGTRSPASPISPKNNVRDAGDRVPTGEGDQPVAILFGPENGPLSERLVREAWDEAGLKHYSHLYVIGFAIDPKARQFIDSAGKIGVGCTYLQATMDLQMGDLLKNMRSSQIFSVCGLPDVAVRPVKPAKLAKSEIRNQKSEMDQWQVELLGLDTFDPVTMEADHLKPADVPAWFLDTDYNGMVFRVRQAFFPRTGAWENLKKALRVEFDETVWDHLAGTTSAPFPEGEHGQLAVKVIDPRGNELLVVKKLES